MWGITGIGVAVGSGVVVGVSDTEGVGVGEGKGVGVDMRGSMGVAVGVAVDKALGFWLGETPVVTRGITGATGVTLGDRLGDTTVALSATLVPDGLALSGIFLALGAKLLVAKLSPITAVVTSERKKLLP